MSRILPNGPGVENRAPVTGKLPGESAATAFTRRVADPPQWQPRRMGPMFRWLSHETIRIEDGGLAGREFGVRSVLARATAGLVLTERNERVAEVSVERDPPGRGVILWDIGVRKDLRGNGLAALMSWCIFRELLMSQDTATFRIRMVRSLKPGENGVEIQNVGICVVAARFGFDPEINLDKVLDSRNITGIDIIRRTNGTPPALKITLACAPLVLVAFVLDPSTMRPVTDEGSYHALHGDEAVVRDWAHLGRLVITNGNYCLRRGQMVRFADLLATDPEEAWLFRVKMRGA